MSKTAYPPTHRWPRAPHCAWSGLALCAGLLLAPFAHATGRTDLYQATVPMPDHSEASHTAAFEAALKTVLIRVTGRRTTGEDAALAALVGEARRYVQQYRAAPDNQLWVAFDANAIDRWLAQNGQPIWGRDRPATFVWLAVPAAGAQGATVARNDDSSDLKAAVDAEAQLRGIPLRWPTAGEIQAHHIDYAAITNSSNATLVDLGRRLGGEGVLIGRPAANAGAPAIRWVLQFHDQGSEFAGITEGIDAAADLYAGLFAASGAPAAVDIEVDGLADVTAYAKVQTYLESLSFVSHVSVRAIDADRAQFRVTVRGGAAALRRAISINGSLEPVEIGGPVLHFHLRP
ncbi:MAG: DUF2066 domain-containing protein [Steroidobacterales bacterium]